MGGMAGILSRWDAVKSTPKKPNHYGQAFEGISLLFQEDLRLFSAIDAGWNSGRDHGQSVTLYVPEISGYDNSSPFCDTFLGGS